MKKEEDQCYSCGKMVIQKKMITLADPTYDLTFKYIFSHKNLIDGINWKKRIKSLLSSLFFIKPIKKITLLNNEHINATFKGNEETVEEEEGEGEEEEEEEPENTKKRKKPNLSFLKSDLVFKLEFEGDENITNIEMQVGLPGKDFLARLLHYGTTLRKENKGMKTIIIGFLNSNLPHNYLSSSFALSQFDMKDNTYLNKVNDFIEVIIINLKEISEKLINDEDIFISGRKISGVGKDWLKLLSLRHWGIKKDDYYEIPEMKITDEIDSAISFLKDLKDESVKTFFNLEEKYQDNLNKVAEALAEKMVDIKTEKLTDKFLKMILNTYKIYDEKLDDIEKKNDIDLSNFDINKIEQFWGKDNPEKLKEIKDYIGKKRKKI